MGQINLSQTDTPQIPESGKTAIFINTSGQPYKKDDLGVETLLAGATEFTALSDTFVYTGKSLEAVRVNAGETALETYVPASAGYPEATIRENNTVLFDGDYVTGNAAARTGNVLFDFTGALLGGSTVMIHNDGSAFTFPTENIIVSGSYVASVDNYISFLLINKTVSSEVVLCTITQAV